MAWPSHTLPLCCCAMAFKGPLPTGHQWRPLWGMSPAPSPLTSGSLPRPTLTHMPHCCKSPPSYLLVRPHNLGHPVGHHSLIPRHREVASKVVTWAGACLGGFGHVLRDHLLDLTERKGREGPKGHGAVPQTNSLRDRGW